MIYKALTESNPDVGSSSKRILGSEISSYPIEVLLRSPPDIPFFNIPPIVVSAQFYNLSFLIIFFTFNWHSISEALP